MRLTQREKKAAENLKQIFDSVSNGNVSRARQQTSAFKNNFQKEVLILLRRIRL